MKRTKVIQIPLKIILWLLMANGLIAMGFVTSNQKSLWQPQYGQDFWWAWGVAFTEAPENIVFIIMGIIALSILAFIKRCKSEPMRSKDD